MMNDKTVAFFPYESEGHLFDRLGNFHAENLRVSIDKDGGSRLALPDNFDTGTFDYIDVSFTSKAYADKSVGYDKFMSDLDRGMLSGKTSIHCGIRGYISDKLVEAQWNNMRLHPQCMPSSRVHTDTRPIPYADEFIISLVRNGNNFEIGDSRLEFHGSEAYDADFTMRHYLDLDKLSLIEKQGIVDAAVWAICEARDLSKSELLDKLERPEPENTATARVMRFSMRCGDGVTCETDYDYGN